MATNDDIFADGQGQSEFTYKPSSHQFTDPIRLFKANDPYYWEVDNIPLNQVQESLLWLKDQVGVAEEVTKLNRADFDELRPTATGEDRVVKVSPGRFMGRVNDAFNTGISTLALNALNNTALGSVENTGISEMDITTPDSTLQALAGIAATNVLADNGLYDYTQHNVTRPGASTNVAWQSGYTSFIQNKKTGVADLQKIKLALWKQGTTVKTYGGNPSTEVDLQQLSVEFTRVYGAPFRTSLVNIPTELTIDIPSFNDEDYQYPETNTYVPSVRVDLLFIYTKPIDAESTTILKQEGESVSKILSPQLGLVKGAGVISLNPKPSVPGAAWYGSSIDENFFASEGYTNNKEDGNLFFDPSGNADAQGNRQVASVLADLNQNTIGVANTYANFPSPDDLMNAAPYITDGVSKTNSQLIGQSVLPIAYIFTKKEKPLIESVDILDIRPFFRTAELTYNERAGIAAANPPMSLANPAVSKYQLADTTTKMRDYVIGKIPPTPSYPRPVGSGYVFGGIKYGPEGVLARAAADDSWDSNTYSFTAGNGGDFSIQSISDWLKEAGYIPNVSGNVPDLPDWDTPPWAEAMSDEGGKKRNDRFYYTYINGPTQDDKCTAETYNFSKDDDFVNKWGNKVTRVGFNDRSGNFSWFVKKRINLDKTNVEWMQDYHVRLTLANCALGAQQSWYSDHDDNNDAATWGQPQGLFIEKYPDYFNIVACWVTKSPFRASKDSGPGSEYKRINGNPVQNRTNSLFSNIFVTSDAMRLNQSPGSKTQTGYFTKGNIHASYMARNGMCTYPTVHFEIIGYPETYTNTMNIQTGTNPTIQLQSSTSDE